jgi:ribosomal-protein-alanine N-acetyltransferase
MIRYPFNHLSRRLRDGRGKEIRDSVLSGVSLIKRQKRTASDYLGSLLTRNWKRLPRRVIATVDPMTLAEVLAIHRATFNSISDQVSDQAYRRYSSIFRHIFYIAKRENRVVGYCVNYIRPAFTQSGLVKTAVVYVIAVDGMYRRQGIGTQLLDTSIEEMRLNNIDEVRLYVNKNNRPALALYRLFGFVVVRELSNVCGPGERCYEMLLAISGRS